LLDLSTNLVVLAATGARSVLGRVPRGCGRELQSVKLLEAVSDLPVKKPMLILREGCLSDGVHPELPLIGAVRMRSNSLSATGVAFVAVAVVLGGFRRLWIGNLFDESGAGAL